MRKYVVLMIKHIDEDRINMSQHCWEHQNERSQKIHCNRQDIRNKKRKTTYIWLVVNRNNGTNEIKLTKWCLKPQQTKLMTKQTLSIRMHVPKSASLRWPWASNNMLSGFTSLHTVSSTPHWCTHCCSAAIVCQQQHIPENPLFGANIQVCNTYSLFRGRSIALY